MIDTKSFTGDDMSVLTEGWKTLAVFCKSIEWANLPQKAVQTVGSRRVIFLQTHVDEGGWFRQLGRAVASFLFQREPFLVPPTRLQCVERIVEAAQKMVQRGGSICSYLALSQMAVDMFLSGRLDLAHTNRSRNGLGVCWPDSFPRFSTIGHPFQEVQSSPVLATASRSKLKSVTETLELENRNIYQKLHDKYPGLEQSESHIKRYYQMVVATMRSDYQEGQRINKNRFAWYSMDAPMQETRCGYAYADSLVILKYHLAPWLDSFFSVISSGEERYADEFDSQLGTCPLFRLDSIARDVGLDSSQSLDELIASMLKKKGLPCTGINYLRCLEDIYLDVAKIEATEVSRQPGFKIAKSVIDGTSSPFGNSKFFSSVLSSQGGDVEAKVRFNGLQDFRGVMKSGGRAIDPWVDENIAAVLHRLAVAVSWLACTTYVPQLDQYYHKFILDKTRPLALMMGLIRNLEKFICQEYFAKLFVQGNRMYGIQMGIENPHLSIEGQLDDLLQGNSDDILWDAGLTRKSGNLVCVRHKSHDRPKDAMILGSHIELTHSGIEHGRPKLTRTISTQPPALLGEEKSW
jgi:hypothetical protein